ncbi:MAG: tRNA epoxyqueuosine(34) reductase QueG [Saprospiraceae bacterium]|nr:tRNA epoxyqueuosine(34) reductase QueG [Saprospiraceae bacterium]MBK9729456.1 tRNA epoxyqueuosine(34) reductase QueG [Saprospiraceae bacterium]
MKHSAEGLKKFAKQLGFDKVGVVKSRQLEDEARKLEHWLHQNYHGEMSYLERYFDFRIDPNKLIPGTKSILVFSLNYFQKVEEISDDRPKISMYAIGKDYHKVIRTKTKALIRWMKSEFGDIQARAFVDSGPVLERVWAHEAGIAWTGKNTLSIHPKSGSYFFLACILTDLEFEYDQPIKDYCGTCRKCIDACPTQAFHSNGYLLDASKCISYLTIELKNAIPDTFHGKMENWIFGCDICQQVCPWNRFSTNTDEEEFVNSKNPGTITSLEWLEMNESEFQYRFNNSALKRTGLKGIQRNIRFIEKRKS